MIQKQLKNKIMRDIREDITTNLKFLNNDNFDLTDCRSLYNYKCHINSVNNVITGRAEKVLLCVAITDDETIVHLINQLSNGKYLDDTWGWYGYKFYNYYLIREVDRSEFDNIDSILTRTQRHYVRKHSNWFTRLLSGVNERSI